MDEEVVLLDSKNTRAAPDVVEVAVAPKPWWKRNGLLVQAIMGAGFLVLVAVAVLVLSLLPVYRPVVVLISIDGFRWDYIDMYPSSTPNLRKIASRGFRTNLKPIFPSKTFPNHYTIVTGLYAESHGIVSNTMYDPVFNATFSLSNDSAVADGRWYGGEPVWVTVQKQGQSAACYFWPGSEAEIGGVRPKYYEQFNDSVPYSARIDTFNEWLSSSDYPTFISFYFSEVDTAGHIYGPNSTEVSQAIKNVDDAIGIMLEKVNSVGHNNVNFIVVSDHGMTEISRDHVILLDEYISLSEVTVVDWSPNVFLIPQNSSRTEQIYEALLTASNLTVWYKKDIPTDYHFSDNRRVTPIFATADLGFSITSTEFYNNNPSHFTGGDHGYDNNNTDMFGIFIGQGPAFKTVTGNSRVVNNVDLYVLICQILGITPSPNNGSLSHVEDLLIL